MMKGRIPQVVIVPSLQPLLMGGLLLEKHILHAILQALLRPHGTDKKDNLDIL